MPKSLPIALVQLRSPDNQAAAFAHAAPLIREAAVGGANQWAMTTGPRAPSRSRG